MYLMRVRDQQLHLTLSVVSDSELGSESTSATVHLLANCSATLRRDWHASDRGYDRLYDSERTISANVSAISNERSRKLHGY